MISREGDMGMVMVRCPQTGHAIPTGIKTDRESFSRSAVFFSRTRCPICRAIMPGSHGKPGSPSRASGSGAAARAPYRVFRAKWMSVRVKKTRQNKRTRFRF